MRSRSVAPALVVVVASFAVGCELLATSSDLRTGVTSDAGADGTQGGKWCDGVDADLCADFDEGRVLKTFNQLVVDDAGEVGLAYDRSQSPDASLFAFLSPSPVPARAAIAYDSLPAFATTPRHVQFSVAVLPASAPADTEIFTLVFRTASSKAIVRLSATAGATNSGTLSVENDGADAGATPFVLQPEWNRIDTDIAFSGGAARVSLKRTSAGGQTDAPVTLDVPLPTVGRELYVQVGVSQGPSGMTSKVFYDNVYVAVQR